MAVRGAEVVPDLVGDREDVPDHARSADVEVAGEVAGVAVAAAPVGGLGAKAGAGGRRPAGKRRAAEDAEPGDTTAVGLAAEEVRDGPRIPGMVLVPVLAELHQAAEGVRLGPGIAAGRPEAYRRHDEGGVELGGVDRRGVADEVADVGGGGGRVVEERVELVVALDRHPRRG